MEINDAAGRTALHTVVRRGQPVDVSRLPRGFYVARLYAGEAMGLSKFSKE